MKSSCFVVIYLLLFITIKRCREKHFTGYSDIELQSYTLLATLHKKLVENIFF